MITESQLWLANNKGGDGSIEECHHHRFTKLNRAKSSLFTAYRVYCARIAPSARKIWRAKRYHAIRRRSRFARRIINANGRRRAECRRWRVLIAYQYLRIGRLGRNRMHQNSYAA